MDQRASCKVQHKKVQLFGSLKNHDIYHGQPEGLEISFKKYVFLPVLANLVPASSICQRRLYPWVHFSQHSNPLLPLQNSPPAKFSMNSDKLSAKSLTDKLPTGMMCFLIKACFQKFCHETRYLRNFGDTSSGDSSCGQRCVPLRNLTLESQEGWLSRDQQAGAR